jgi:uridine phosphorylase
MNQKIAASELVLNPDGSLYHINLKPGHLADDIIFVGDQDRVPKISKYFDKIDFETRKREFRTVTGWYKSKRITVISTGIGPDNIDIVMNELDALANIDLLTRTIKSDKKSLNIVRIGTSGSLQADIPVDGFVLSEYGLGFDGLLHAYKSEGVREMEMEEAFIAHTRYDSCKARPYIVKGSQFLKEKLISDGVFTGITATANGFFGPQGRVLRLPLKDKNLNDKLESFRFKENRITNLEMETSAIYGLSLLMGHQALSLNAIIANRPGRAFSKDPYAAIERLIIYTLDRLAEF